MTLPLPSRHRETWILEPVPWLQSYLQGRFNHETGTDYDPPRPAPTIEPWEVQRANARQPRVRVPRPVNLTLFPVNGDGLSVLQAAVVAVLKDHWMHPEAIAQQARIRPEQARRTAWELWFKGAIDRDRGPCRNNSRGMPAWWYRRKS